MQSIVKNVITCSLLIGNCVLAMDQSKKAPVQKELPALNTGDAISNHKSRRNGVLGSQLVYTKKLDKENRERNKLNEHKESERKRKEDKSNILETGIRNTVSSAMSREDISHLASFLDDFLYQSNDLKS